MTSAAPAPPPRHDRLGRRARTLTILAGATAVVLAGGIVAVRAASDGRSGSGCYSHVPRLPAPHGFPSGPSPHDLTNVRTWVTAHPTWAAGFAPVGSRTIAVGVTKDPCTARDALHRRLSAARVVLVPAEHNFTEVRAVRVAVLDGMRRDTSLRALGIDEVIQAYDGRLIISLGAEHPSVDQVTRELAERFTQDDPSWFFVAEATPQRVLRAGHRDGAQEVSREPPLLRAGPAYDRPLLL